jgi:predicted RNase H-like HicB family nuclease
MDYIAFLHKDRKSDYGVSFPDFPGCVTAAKTSEEARSEAVEALLLHLAGIVEDGETVPRPSVLDNLKNHSAMAGTTAFLVEV